MLARCPAGSLRPRIHSKGYVTIYVPGHPRASGGRVYEHIVVAERALRKPLPRTAQVHHVNEVRSENRPGNLVICQDAAYHKLLHLRLRALRQGGNANFLWCRFCKRWDDPAAMWVHPRRPMAAHRECQRRAPKATPQEGRTIRRRHRADLSRVARGEGHGSAKLTVGDVVEMRSLWRRGGVTAEALGALFGVATSHAHRVATGKTWKHIPMASAS